MFFENYSTRLALTDHPGRIFFADVLLKIGMQPTSFRPAPASAPTVAVATAATSAPAAAPAPATTSLPTMVMTMM